MNSGYIPEAILARLHQTNPEAIALNAGPRLLRDIEASLRVQLQQVADFAEVFRLMADSAPGTSALLLILDRHTVSAHVVLIVNPDGAPLIIEGQSWGPTYPADTFTTPAQAQARYGAAVDLKLGVVPPPTAR
ncbi:toxin glutamine deamidase domain-containing protein [Hymenobacter monticola]|uniref:Toxin glutamine deamidase domain-containing protein n=1 Tax=Hymenobacter monticola TaxID=1705399 RepID=A0ABY4B5B9_9BACT|nr:toxin glutamine deamidase domain-containing protein [Hymenobacter monticola]UOE34357.1 toxin glutamine deamidase domain-containing protein [Hymenobacter monticola]